VGIVHGAIALSEFQDYEDSRFEMGNYPVFVVDNTGSFILRDHKHPEAWNYTSIFDELETIGDGQEQDSIRRKLSENLTMLPEMVVTMLAPQV
jgi:hypothetical protein